ncbi:alpha/beta hydrolase family protein [Cognatilysobacter bugurensis]|uniref:Peptidase S9 n=1 Tax=Cognatilysobacter bugurensis TaxID=543356 RepID=A0A918SZI1_9GAMM|nr:S9 family peptidase [Lysobacter bugurensis]GHA79183.1 peptidase S9 [Lysobacter bugurensis]
MDIKRVAVLGLLLGAIGLVPVAMPVQAAAPVNLEHYLRRDGYGRIKISPDGQYYAATVEFEDRGGLVIIRRADNKVVGGAQSEKHAQVDEFWWAKPDRVVLSTAERFGTSDQLYATGMLYALGVDGGRVKTLVGPRAEPGLVHVYGDTGPWEMASLIDPLPADPAHVLIAAWDMGVDPKTRVEKLDVYTGRRSVVASAPVRRARFVTDVAGRVRFAAGRRDDNALKLFYRDSDAGEWRLINDEAESGRAESALGFAGDGVTAYLQVPQPQGPDAVVAWNTRTGVRTEIQRDSTVDPYEPVYAPDGRTLIGMQYMDANVRTRLFDETTDTARIYGALGKAFADAAVTITSYTNGGQQALVQVWNDRTPGDTYLFDTKALTAKGLFVAREWFDPAQLPATRAVEIKARDGLTLRGYLTPPRGAGPDGPWPLVLMPHGGPFGVFDKLSFDEDAHLLAEAGYAVLRVNYRGSSNYGIAFQRAGAREWGARMQDDLTDATRWAIEQGIADGKRICIVGASYGGYAALMGVAREPELYRCAVGYVGVYDLEALHRDRTRTARWMQSWANDWMGERDSLKARSPIHMAEQIRAPVLLVAGGEDLVAPISHTKKMERALRSADKSVETLYVASEGHGFYAKDNRRTYYTRLLDFLARHLGGATATAAASQPARTAAGG